MAFTASGRRRGPGALVVAFVVSSTVALGAAPSEAVASRAFVRSWGNPPLQAGDFAQPRGIASSASGQVFVLDTSAGWVQAFEADGTFVRGWGAPAGSHLAVSPVTGNVLVSSFSQCTVREYTPTGTAVRTFGSCGSGAAQVSQPSGLSVAADGTVYVADVGNGRVQRFSSTGDPLGSWPASGVVNLTLGADGVVHVAGAQSVKTYTTTGTLVRSFTGTSMFDNWALATGSDGSVYVTSGSGVKKFSALGAFVSGWGSSLPTALQLEARDVTVGANGDVYVVDETNRRVERFTDTGSFVDDWGTYTRDGRVRAPAGMDTDAAGNVYVADQRNHQVQVFDANGAFLRKWRHAAPGEFLDRPIDVAVDTNGDVYVTNSGRDRVERYDDDGTWLATIGAGQLTWPKWLALDGQGHVFVADRTAGTIKEFTTSGTFLRSFGRNLGVEGIDVGADGTVYVVDQIGHQVQHYSATGTFLGAWGSEGAAEGEFSDPRALGVDATGDVYVTDCGTDRVQRFSPSGELLDATGTAGTGDGQFSCPSGIAFGGASMYVADDNGTPGDSNDRIQQFAYAAAERVDASLETDEADVSVGDTVHAHLTIDNLGTGPLTGVSTTSTKLTDCARSLADIPALASLTVDCTYEATAADLPQFTASVTVHADQAPPEATNEVTIDVSHLTRLHQVREWYASETSLLDADPIAPPGPGNGGRGLTTDAAGHVYVVGSRDHPLAAAVARFGGDGQFDRQWGAPGQAPGSLWRPDSVAVTPDGDVFTTECTDVHRVQRFSADGTPERVWASPAVPGAPCAPADVAVGPDGTAYVTDPAHDLVATISGDTVAPGWGSHGSGPGRFDDPRGVAVAPDGTVYVVDGGNRRVQRFSPTGQFLGEFGSAGTGNGRFVDPRDLAVTDTGLVIVADFGDGSGGQRVQVFSPTGTYLTKVAVRTEDVAVHTDAGGNVHLYVFPYRGSDPSGVVREYVAPAGAYLSASLTPDQTQVSVRGTVGYDLRIENVGTVGLTGITVDAGGLSGCGGPADDLAPGESLTLACSHRATADEVGRHHVRATVDAAQAEPFTTVNTGIEVLLPSDRHWGWDRLSNPRGVVANWQDDLYVADCGQDQVLHYRSDGTFVGAWGASGTGPGQLDCPVDITINSAGHLLVLDRDNRRVQELTSTGGFVRAWATGTDPNFGLGTSLDTDDDDHVYVADLDNGYYGEPCEIIGGIPVCTSFPPSPANNFVREFAPDGSSVGQWSRTNVSGLAATGAGEIVVARATTIEVRTTEGALLDSFTNAGNPETVGRVTVDRFGNIWATYPSRNLLRKFTPGGYELARWSVPGSADVAVDRDHVYVVDSYHASITRLGPVASGEGGIEGTVTDASNGAPVPGAQVAMLRAADFVPVGGATAGSDGAFRADAAPGTYRLYVLDPSGGHAPTLHGAVVTVTDGGTVHADPAMAPARGAVDGTVVEDGTGDPVAGAWVIALDGATGAPRTGTATDASGHYHLGGLPAGDHLLAFVDPAGGHAAEFFDGATTGGAATTLHVTAGTTLTADGSLAEQPTVPATATLTGQVRGEGITQGYRLLANVGVIALSASDFHLAGATVTGTDGTYSLAVPPGAYKVIFLDGRGWHDAEWYDNRPYDQLAAADSVTAPGTISPSLFRRTGRILAGARDGGTGEYLGGIWILAIGPSGVSGSCTTTVAFGSCAVEGLTAGTYQVLYLDPTGAHAAEYWRGRRAPDNRDPVNLAVGGEASLVTTDLGP